MLIMFGKKCIASDFLGRVRGLVNFRSEPTTPYSGHGAKPFFPAGRTNTQSQQKIAAEGDRIAQMDVEHMGLMS